MSPSEDDLRAALRDGETTDPPDVVRVLTRARQHHARRTRLLSAAAVVVLVGAVGVGAAALTRRHSDSEVGAGSAGSAGSAGAEGGIAASVPGALAPAPRGAATPNASAASGGGGVSGGSATSPGVGCPASVPHFVLPTGRPRPFFAGAVASIVACTYPTGGSGPVLRVEFSGQDATTFAASLEHATAVRPGDVCPMIRSADQRSLVVIGLDAAGKRNGLVETAINLVPCAVVVSNGSTQRYAWTPPASLAVRLAGSATGQAPITGPSSPHRVYGSPINS